MNPWLPIVVLGALAAGFATVSVVAGRFLGPHRTSGPGLDPYECGVQPGRSRPRRFPIRFYVTAMLFILLDVDIVFLYPWAVNSRAFGVFGLVEMGLFMVPVLVAYAYVWRRGGLEWD
ncbi:NADH-quinone oxidoreductase subunit A [Amycolatopsis sp. K13G38]|uniref:NADH-quinone oxidoreductase subunit n=1 Tax=Amycolatopsis acididurans TaxID=2724524 RepID=A0ABX1J3I9_9PSEU|nr:NADH-quinone oxidoreductase subunit A [Amycolatopsis acididurans]NKQ54347.1 NADH-quinone oxidoreductase subunit A [Amycolatopsis acididurans]